MCRVLGLLRREGVWEILRNFRIVKGLATESNFDWRDFLRPGCLVAVVGLLLILGAIVGYALNTPGSEDMVENLQNRGGGIKYLGWLVVGIGCSILGALMAFVDFRRT